MMDTQGRLEGTTRESSSNRCMARGANTRNGQWVDLSGQGREWAGRDQGLRPWGRLWIRS